MSTSTHLRIRSEEHLAAQHERRRDDSGDGDGSERTTAVCECEKERDADKGIGDGMESSFRSECLRSNSRHLSCPVETSSV
jgi:hypothetical protein